MTRTFQKPLKRVVVKLGSSQIADNRMKPRMAELRALARQISQLHQDGVEVIVVSSGAIALGMGELGENKRPSVLAQLQARAAIGQAILMHTYRDLFAQAGLKCAQVLLTYDDFDNHARYLNARHTLNAILGQGVVPVINENDTTSTEEIKFGDNDKLSALVASAVDADLLVMLSDVDGLYDQNKQLFKEVRDITPEIKSVASGTKNAHMARGGMVTKLEAIYIVNHAKIPCVITAGHTSDVLVRLVAGERLGTFFVEKEKKIVAHKHWIAFVATPKGFLYVDEGAKNALMHGKSLLLPGVKEFQGYFKAQDVVQILDQSRAPLGKGIINYSSVDLSAVGEKKGKKEVIHCDHLVLMGN